MMQLRAGGLATHPIERGEIYRVIGERLALRAPLTTSDTDAAEWLASRRPELAAPSACLLASGLELMPAWAGDRLAR